MEKITLNDYIASASAGGIQKMACPSCGQRFDVTDIPAFMNFICPVCSKNIIRPLWVDTFQIDSQIEESDNVISQVNAVDMSLDRTVTLHILNPFYASSEDRRRMFIETGRTLAILNDPSIMTVFNIGTIGNLPYLVTPDISGKTLKEYLIFLGGILPLDTACSVISLIASGLQLALNRGLCHGELNTVNVIIDEMTDKPALINFGMYKLLQNAGYININIFSAPETAEYGTVDSKSDIFSLGALFYYTLTGEKIPVIENEGQKEINYNIISKNVNDTISGLICKMLSQAPQERPDYQDIINFLNDRLQHIRNMKVKHKK